MSCTSARTCIAVGTSFKGDGHQYTMAERWDSSGGWTIQPTPNPDGPSAVLDGVSCLSPTDCTAVGYYSSATTAGEHLVIEHLAGTSWTIQSIQEPAGAIESELYAVSCGSPTSCTAVGQFFRQGGATQPLVEHWNGTAWAMQQVPFVQFAIGQLGGVSCPTATDCVAVGSYGTLNQDSNLFAERWNGSRWTFTELPTPAGSSFLLTAVSCLQPQSCVAAGFVTSGSAPSTSIIERAAGGNWTVQQDAAPAQTQLFGVSCTSPQSCTAVGEAFSDPKFTNTGLAEHWNGTSWAIQATPVPQPGATGPGFFGISCTATQACTAVGGYSDHGDRALADREG